MSHAETSLPPTGIAYPLTRRRKWRLLGLTLLGIIALLILLAPFGLITVAVRPSSDAIVILGGSATYRERAQRAAELWRAGRAPYVVVTNDEVRAGWDVPRQRNVFFFERAVEELQAQGVPPARIIVMPQPVANTHDEAETVKQFAVSHGFKSLQFVTSAYHTRRAHRVVARALQNSAIEFAVDAPPPGIQTPRPLLWWTSATGWKLVPGEYAKMIYYFFRY